MYTIHFTDHEGRTEHYGHVRTMKLARAIKAKLESQGYTVQFWYVAPVEEEFIEPFTI